MTEPENLHTKFANFEQLVATQHGELMDALSGLSTKLSQVISAIGAIPSGSTNMAPTNAILNEMADLLGTISSSIGVPDADLPVNALTWLDHIAANTLRMAECCEGGGTPPTSEIGGCTAPIASSGATSRMADQGTFGGTGVSINMFTATFTLPLSNGLTGDTTAGLQYESMYIAAPRDGWDGWRIYVQSDAPTYADDFPGNVQYPTNTWRNLTGSSSIILSVYPNHSIKVYLCPPGDNGGSGIITECTELDASLVGILPRNGTKSSVYAVRPPSGMDASTTIHYLPFDVYEYDDNVVFVGDFFGWRVRLLSGDNAMVSWTKASDSTGVAYVLHNIDESVTVNDTTEKFAITNEVNNNTPTSQFSIELCPPAPE